MNKGTKAALLFLLVAMAGFGYWWAGPSTADDDHWGKRHFEREIRKHAPFSESDDEGNETAGQIAAWLLLMANLPVAVSLLVKGTNRYMPLGDQARKALVNFNRVQKKRLMPIHYYLNLAILGIVLWHWLASRCKSSALPELGLAVMVTLISLGFLMKFNLVPRPFRRYARQIHTQPVIFLAMFLVLTVGHLIVD